MESPEPGLEIPNSKEKKLALLMRLAMGNWERMKVVNEKVSFFQAMEVQRGLRH